MTGYGLCLMSLMVPKRHRGDLGADLGTAGSTDSSFTCLRMVETWKAVPVAPVAALQ
jgi:hypothetical protein